LVSITQVFLFYLYYPGGLSYPILTCLFLSQFPRSILTYFFSLYYPGVLSYPILTCLFIFLFPMNNSFVLSNLFYFVSMTNYPGGLIYPILTLILTCLILFQFPRWYKLPMNFFCSQFFFVSISQAVYVTQF
jgi:hypothetical protein